VSLQQWELDLLSATQLCDTISNAGRSSTAGTATWVIFRRNHEYIFEGKTHQLWRSYGPHHLFESAGSSSQPAWRMQEIGGSQQLERDHQETSEGLIFPVRVDNYVTH
jgi:hypothetical protein